MTIRIRFSDDDIINIENVPSGWFWIDVADILLENGEITPQKYDIIYGHEDAEKEAVGVLQIASLDHTKDGQIKDIKNDEAQSRSPAHNSEEMKTYIPPPTTITPVQKFVNTAKIYELKVTCSKNRQKWISSLTSPHKPMSNTELKINSSMGISSTRRVHLILDDSGSMRKNNAFTKLKKGVYSFLNNVKNAQVGIRWFNSVGLPIQDVGEDHKLCVSAGIPKGGNDHAQSLFDLIQKSPPNRAEASDVVVMFTDGKPNGKGKNVIQAANSLKNRGVKIITIGCGESEPGFMKKIASSPDEHHQIDDMEELVNTFGNIGKSLAQLNVRSSDTGIIEAVAPARQIHNREYVSNTSVISHGSYSSLRENQGFDYIADFSCYYCDDEVRVICSGCGITHCGGNRQDIDRKKLGQDSSKPNSQHIECPKCGNIAVLDFTGSVFASTSDIASKKN